eukprot:scaffold88341_cov69-Phaeocystis_antarctica.AAC.1
MPLSELPSTHDRSAAHYTAVVPPAAPPAAPPSAPPLRRCSPTANPIPNPNPYPHQVLSNSIKQKRKEKAGKWNVPIPKVRPPPPSQPQRQP